MTLFLVMLFFLLSTSFIMDNRDISKGVIITSIIHIFTLVSCFDFPPCRNNDLTDQSCSAELHRLCSAIEGNYICVCIPGYDAVANKEKPDEFVCIPTGSDVPITTESHITAIVVVFFTLILIISGLTIVVRRYKLLDYIRQKIPFHRRNEVLYEDVMIGQDDPPITA